MGVFSQNFVKNGGYLSHIQYYGARATGNSTRMKKLCDLINTTPYYKSKFIALNATLEGLDQLACTTNESFWTFLNQRLLKYKTSLRKFSNSNEFLEAFRDGGVDG
jgi:hypothetical protein